MSDTTNPVDLNLTPTAFASAWADYLVAKVTTGPYTLAEHGATRAMAEWGNFVDDAVISLQKKHALAVLSAREYGATGDGVADDTQEIQDAIDAANALGGGVVMLGAGTFKISTPLTLYAGTNLVGVGPQDTTLNYTGVDYAIVQSTPETLIEGVRLEGFKLSFATATAAGGLDLNSISNSVFANLHILSDAFGTGVCARLQATAANQELDNVFIACHFEGGATGLKIGPTGANRNKVIGCIAEHCTTGILIADGASNVVQSCTILDNTTGIEITESGGTLSTGNHIDACLFDEQVTRNISITTAGIDYTRVTHNFFATTPGADVNNGTSTYAAGNLPAAAPWAGMTIAGDLLPAADSTYDLGATGNEWAEAHVDALYVTGVTTVGNDIISDTDSTDDLGSNAVRWANLYVDDITCTTSVTTGGTITAGGNIVSDTDSTDDLGTNAVRWANLYVDAVTCTDNVLVSGNANRVGGGQLTPGSYDIVTFSSNAAPKDGIRVQDVTTDSADKNGCFYAGTYTNAHNPICVIRASGTSSANNMRFGGTTTDYAPTVISFSTASALNTTGTIKWYLSGDGYWRPNVTATYDIGTNTNRVRRIATGMISMGFRNPGADASITVAHTDRVIFLNTTSGAKAITNSYGAVAGDTLEFRCVAGSGGSYTLTCTLDGAAGTMTFDAAGEYAKVIYDGSVWQVVNYVGATHA